MYLCPNARTCGNRHCYHSGPHEHGPTCGEEICKKNYGFTFNGKCVKINKEKEKEMNETKIGYKVVLNDNENKLVSASVGSGKVIYAKDITVKPRMWGGPLTVFFSKFRAIGFIATLSDEKRDKCSVYKCEYEPTKAMSVWRLKDLMIDSKPLCDLPEGTALAKSVTLKEKIFG